jgi:DUF218 domain-containing protein
VSCNGRNRCHRTSKLISAPIGSTKGYDDLAGRKITVKPLTIAAIVFLVCALLFLQPGGYLIVNSPQKSDAIVVLWGDQATARYLHALELLRSGYGQHLVVDAHAGQIYGQSIAALATDFVARTAGENASQVSLCIIGGESTKEEAREVEQCLERLQPAPHSAILVTDDYHTRRALSIFRQRLPQYRWTAAANHDDSVFGQPWWKNREWAKTYLTECEKLVWWELWDRWQP